MLMTHYSYSDGGKFPRVKVVLRASRGKYGEVGVKGGVVTVWTMIVLATFTPTCLLLEKSRSRE